MGKKYQSMMPVWILAVCLAIFLGGCASTTQKRSLGEVIDDAVLTSKVKSKLVANEDGKGFAINVDTWKGRVTLSGNIPQAQEKMIVDLAQSVAGVRTVTSKFAYIVERQEMTARQGAAVSEPVVAKPALPSAPKPDKVSREGEVLERDLGGSSPSVPSNDAAASTDTVKDDTGFWTRPPQAGGDPDTVNDGF